MTILSTFDNSEWGVNFAQDVQKQAITALEEGKILYFPRLGFSLSEHEKRFLSPEAVSSRVKNISYDIRKNKLKGTNLNATQQTDLQAMMHRYAVTSQDFLKQLLGHYKDTLEIARTSFRPAEIKGRISSYRKDDTLLHVDAFPATPNHGRRILRIFTNINPHGQARIWRAGEPFADVVNNFGKELPSYKPFSAKLMQLTKITKDYRTAYDHYMLHLHNTMKSRSAYQANVPQEELQLVPNSTWVVFTDVVSHAAMSGQYALEQTFYLDIDAMADHNRAPISILANYLGKTVKELRSKAS